MKNSELKIEFDPESGGIAGIHTCPEMSFCESEGNKWGTPRFDFPVAFNRNAEMKLVCVDEKAMSATYSNGVLKFKTERELKDGCLYERFTVTNVSTETVFAGNGDLSIYTPFNDSYEAASDCLEKRCHAHLNMCGSDSCVLALRMGNYENNLGLALLRGSLSSYSVENPPYAKNDRGNILLDVSGFSLESGENLTLEWVLFECRDEEDFDAKRLALGQCVIDVEAYNLYIGESIHLTAKMIPFDDDVEIFVNGEEAFCERDDDKATLAYTPEKTGEYRVTVKYADRETTALFYVAPSLDELVSARVRFICEKQQYHKTGSPLDGAYILYDNDTQTQYYSAYVADHNACRERIGMGLLILKYLQKHEDREVSKSLEKYIAFVLREMVDEETGNVFDGLGRDPSNLRLYNAPWVCNFFCELYAFSENRHWAALAFKIMEAYYKNGGDHFYPNAYTPLLPVNTLIRAGLFEEAAKLTEYSKTHAQTIMKNGTDYPKHEVDYEQTIVAPAATILLGMYALTEDTVYLEAAKPHVELLERFGGHGYDYHLYENAIRHWDDYWFGGEKTFGDTFPHYWSVLSGYAFGQYAKATDDAEMARRAENGVRGSLCLFDMDGSASCAYVFPHKVNGKKGKFFDPWANDQDYALYYALLTERN